jgi:hypothetical protein
MSLIVSSCYTSLLSHQVLSSKSQNYAVFLLTDWLFVLFNMSPTLFQWEIRTLRREKEGL